MISEKKQLVLGITLLWLGLMFSFWETIDYSYVNYDDPAYLLDNPLSKLSLSSPAFWDQLWTESTVNLWHPLTVLSHQVLLRISTDWGIHHIFNVILHGGTSTLWCLCLFKVIKKPLPAIIASLIYAWHPVTVESVAWLSGRKDLLAGFFIILSFLFHLCWVNKQSKAYYILCFVSGCFAMMSKPIAFLIPVILILIDLWPLRRELTINTILKEKLPWLVPAVITVALTLLYQSQGGQALDDDRTFTIRGAGALWAIQHALHSSLIPLNLHLSYEDPQTLSPMQIIGMASCFIFLLTASIYYFKRIPYALIGLLIFIIFLAPTLGLIRAGNHLAADRYCYLPLLGFSLIIAGALVGKKTITPILVSIVAFCLLFIQKKQVNTWESLETLSRHTLTIEPNNPTANAQMALFHFDKKEIEIAEQYIEKTLTSSPNHVGANLMSATIAKDNEEWKLAEKHYRIASKLRTTDPILYHNLAHCLIYQERHDEALELLHKALTMTQDSELGKLIQNDIEVIKNRE